MATTKYSHAFLVGSFNIELKPEQLDTNLWEQEIISVDGNPPRYNSDKGYNGLCTRYYKAHLDAMIEGQGVNRPDFLKTVHHYIHHVKGSNGKAAEIMLPVDKGKNRETPFIYLFRLCCLHLYFFPLDIVLFAIEIDDTGTELEDLTLAHDYLMNRWDTYSFNNPYLAGLMMPLMAYLVTGKVSRLTKDGNKLKIFQAIEVEDHLFSDDLLYELGTSLPVGCVKNGKRPDVKPAENYYNQLLSENIISTFDNWKGLALVDSFTILGKKNSLRRNDCNFLYFPLIYLRCILEKTFCFSRNNAYRVDKAEDGLASDLEQMEKYYFYDNISYNFLPNLLYKIIANGLCIKEERDGLARQIKEQAKKKMQDLKEKEDKRFNRILACASIFAVFSIAWDLSSIMKEAFFVCYYNSDINARIFLALGVLVIMVLVCKIYGLKFNNLLRTMKGLNIKNLFRNSKGANIKSLINIKGKRIKASKHDASSIIITDKVRNHLARHFKQGLIGSKFFKQTPDELLKEAGRLFPKAFSSAKLSDDGRYHISLTFPYVIGVCNVVNIDDLTTEERKRIEITDREGQKVRSVKTDRYIFTHECQIFLSDDWYLISMFPGEIAPPLPDSPDVHDAYWDYHVFIENEIK